LRAGANGFPSLCCPKVAGRIVILLEQKNQTMDATYNFSLGFPQGSESKTETPDGLVNQKAIQMISTGISLVSLFLGFSIFGILIIVNQRQAELNDLSGGSSCATVGGIGALLVGTAFLVAACHHWRFGAWPIWKSACMGRTARGGVGKRSQDRKNFA
jgi:hypothetical protein